LNFGCGSIQPEGWVNLDADRDFGSPYGSLSQFACGTFDLIVAHCVLQMTPYGGLLALLTELRLALRPGGVLRVSLPDLARGFTAYAAGDLDWFPNGEADLDARFSNWLTWYSTSRSLLTPGALLVLLDDAGYRSAQRYEYGAGPGAELDDRQGEVYFIGACR
jgi:SAM-dependent methyltransferase